MQPGPVKARLKGQLYIPHQRFVGRSRIDPVRIEALVQYQALKNRLAVQQYLFPEDSDFPHAKVAVHNILPKGKLQVI